MIINNVGVRVYTPKSDFDKLPAIIFYHGGKLINTL